MVGIRYWTQHKVDATMKLATVSIRDRAQVVIVEENRVVTTTTEGNMQYLIRRRLLPGRGAHSYSFDEVRFEPPVTPSKIIAIGKNYAEHAKETGSSVPKAPLIFAKFPSALTGHEQPITWSSSITQQVDWEGELAVIIGKRARNVSEEDALDHIFGYSIANDVSARDIQIRTDAQWTRGKGLDTFCPLGPWIVTRDEITDAQALSVKTVINGETRQDGNTKDMIFNIPALIAYCSRMFTLEPGDVLLTGTPSGVGEGMKPPTYLQNGDVVAISIDGIGTLRNTCVVTE